MSCKPTCKCCTPKRRLRCWFSCGVASFIMTIFFALAVGLNLTDELFFLIIRNELLLLPHSSVLDDWADNDVPSYKTFYIFDTQNPDQYSDGAVPVVREVGPFTYRQYDKKVNLTWNNDESLVTYNRVQYYTFVPEKSIGDPRNYNVTILNFPLLIVLNQQQQINNLLLEILGSAAMIEDQSLFVTKTVQEFIWGYEDPIFRMLYLLGLVRSPLMHAQLNTTDPSLLYTVRTGKKDINSIDSLVRWKNLTRIVQWGSEDARRICGSISGHFKPRMDKHGTVLVFVEPLFRHTEAVYTSEASLYGINLYRHEPARHSFSNSSEYPPNAAYYAYNYKYGVVNLTAVSLQNLPLYFSKPHCLDCDPEYFKNVSGYHPDENKHETFVRIEPFTGISMEFAIRGQRNIRIERNSLSRQLSHVPDVTLYPFYYNSHEATITEDKADDFKLSVQLPRTILKISAILFLCVSGVTMLCTTGVLLRLYHNGKCLWTSAAINKSPQKTSNSPASINNSDDSKSPLLDSGKTKDYHTIGQSTL